MLNTKHPRRTALRVAESAALVVAGYPALLRKRCLTWGATHEERVREMPGDDLLPDAFRFER